MLRSRIVRVVPLLVAGAFVTATPAAAPAPAGSFSQEVRALNGEALRLQSEARRQKSQAVDGRAAQSLERRQKALRSLMERDPAAAAAIALPDRVLQQLGQTFPTQTANLEQRGSWDGEIEYLIEDDLKLKSHRKIFKLHRGGETLDVKFAGREPPGMKTGQKLRLRGVRSMRTVAATEVEVLDAFMGTGAGALAQDANAAQCSTTGAQPILTVLVNLPNYGLPSVVTPDYMRGVLFGSPASSPNYSVDDFWQQSSDGRTWVDPGSVVVGPISLSSDFNKTSAGTGFCDNYGLRDAVIAAIDGQVDFRNYSRIQLVMPNNGACGWSGTANVGCRTMSSPGDGTFTASVAWLRADQITTREYAVELTTHELGHNLTLLHANSRGFGAEPLGAVGTTGLMGEYGDSFSTMGSWNLGFYAAPQAANQLGWLSQVANYTTVESAGTYTIQNFEARPAGVKALKVRRGTGNNAWLWLESRQPVNAYSSSLYSTAHNGALIHYEDSFTSSDSHLLDFNANTSGNFADAPLQVGRTWSDPYSNLTLTVNSVSSTGMTATVNYGAKTCMASEPTVTLSPTAASAEQGKSTQLAVTVRNNSTAECGNEVFALASAAAGSLTTSLGSASITVSPGQFVQTTLNVAVPAAFPLGTYSVSVAASGSTSKLTGTGAANVTVTEPVIIVCSTAPPTLSVSPTDVSVVPGTSGNFTALVKNNSSQACSAETYSLASTLPAGWTGGVSGTSVTVAPGATSQMSVFFGVPAGTALATYPVSFSLRDGNGTVRGTASASVRVATTPTPTPPPPSGTCTRSTPSIEMSPGQVSIEQGGAMQLAVTVRSNSSDGCGVETIRLASVVPKGWSDAFGGNEVALAPGDIARLSLSVAVPSTFQMGTYSVLAKVTSADSGQQAEAVANVTVTKPVPPPCTAGTPTLSVSPSSATVLAGGTVQLTLTAGNANTSTCEAEAFGLGASVPSGWEQSLGTSALTIASGAQGSTTLTVQVPASQTAGTFQIGMGVTGAKSGLKATQLVSATVEVPAPPPTPTPTPTPTPPTPEPTPTPPPPEPTPTPTPTPPTPEPTPVPPTPEPTPTPPTPSPSPPVTPEKPVTPAPTVQLYVVVSKKNRGTVVVSETGQSCRKSCSFGFTQSATTTITLTATASGQSAFVGWSGACSGVEPTCTVTMDGAKSVTALFVKRKK